MTDLAFTDAGFSATQISVRAVSDAGREFMAKHFGAGAVGADLLKSGGYAMMAAVAAAGLKYNVEDGE